MTNATDERTAKDSVSIDADCSSAEWPPLTDEESAAMAAMDLSEILGSKDERIQFLIQTARRYFRERNFFHEEVKRLKAGKLTPEEFNELCHNLHEQGRPFTRQEHAAECEKFRETLFGPMDGERIVDVVT